MKNNTQNKISVIVPFFNAEVNLPKCLKTLKRQTLTDIEFVLIDDGSTDDSLKLAKNFASKNSNIKVLHQNNSGAGAARNLGIRHSSGDYIAFLDADDRFHKPNTLQYLYTKAKEQNATCVGGGLMQLDGTNKRAKWVKDEINSGFVFQDEGFINYSDYQFDYGFYRFIYKRDFLISNDLFFPDFRRFQDPPFFVRTLAKAEQFYALPLTTYVYTIKPVNNFSLIQAVDCLKGILEIIEFSRENRLPRLHYISLHRLYRDFFHLILPHIRKENTEICSLLMKIYFSIDNTLLEKTDFINEYEKIETLFHIDIIKIMSERLSTATLHLENIKNSVSFKAGRLLTFLPRKIRGHKKRKTINEKEE